MDTNEKGRDEKLWRDLVAYWIIGLCNNYGYVVMLSAAHDIIGQFETKIDKQGADNTKERDCHILSTGVILLADILPGLVVKTIAPFLPFWINLRIFIAVLFSTMGFVLVGSATVRWVAIFGVVITAISCSLGESSFLAYTANFNSNVISTWSSGTGAAGIAGTVSYALLKAAELSNRTIMFVMIIVPIVEAIAFWKILRRPAHVRIQIEEKNTIEFIRDEEPLDNLKDKIMYVVTLLKYMIPLVVVYVAEYFINQGLFELVYFRNAFIDHAAQYRWYNVDYQIGVFISRSSVNLISIDRVWILSVLQCVNVCYFLSEVIYYITPNIWIIFAIVFWEGLFGGGAYVNTFYKMSKEIPPNRRRFAMGIVTIADSAGIAIAGFAAMPVHNIMCKLPEPTR